MDFFKLYLKNNKLNNMLVIIFSIISAYLSYIISEKLKIVFNFISIKDNFKSCIMSIIIMYILLFILSMLSNLFQNVSLFKGNRNLSIYSLDKLLRTDYSHFVNDLPAQIYSDVGMLANNISSFLNSIIMIISILIQFIVYSIIIFKVNIYAGVYAIAFVPIIFLSTLGVNEKLAKHQSDFKNYNKEMFAKGFEILDLAKNIKSKQRESFFCEQVKEKNEKLNNSIIKFSVYESYCNNILNLIIGLAPILVFYILINFVFIDNIKQEDIIVLYMFIPLLLSSFHKIYNCILQFYKTKPYIKQFEKYKYLKPEVTGEIEIKTFHSLKTNSLKVNFGNNKCVEIPDMIVNKGDKILVKGESGIGKSTLFNIILGLRKEYEGNLSVNNINIKDIDINSLRKVIGISFQNSGIYSMSIEENIKLGSEVNIDSITKVLELDKLINDRKEKTISANTISGGEKSRISIAQSIIQNPEVILIDESITSLDEDMEERIMKNIIEKYKQSTIICISHRKSTEKYFDKTITFENGGIA